MKLRIRGQALEIERGHPLIMGILNVGVDSVADGRLLDTLRARVERGLELVEQGAQIVDVGAISGRTDTAAISEQAEIDLLVPVVRELSRAGVTVSVDTWRARVVARVLEAGAMIVNDVSGLADPEVARLSADSGAALVVMHTRAAPKERSFPGYADPTAEVLDFLAERMRSAESAGLSAEQVIIDPGLDYTKTPEQSVEVLRRLDELHTLRRPILLAVSRKYFVGMLTGSTPERRLAGTLAALDFGIRKGAGIVRVHDVAEAVEFLTVRAALNGAESPVMQGDRGDPSLMWIAPKRPAP